VAAEELALLVDSGDNGVMTWMVNTAEATASWLAETTEGKDSIGVVGGIDRVSIASWMAETALASHCGWQSVGVASWVAETAKAMTSWVAEGKDSIDVALWVAETALALHCGRRRQCWHCVVGGREKGGDGVMGGGGQRQHQHCIVGGRDSVGVASWAAETASALHCGWQRGHWPCVVGGGDNVGVVLWAAETALASGRGWRRQR
jgi:hypothetical protein